MSRRTVLRACARDAVTWLLAVLLLLVAGLQFVGDRSTGAITLSLVVLAVGGVFTARAVYRYTENRVEDRILAAHHAQLTREHNAAVRADKHVV
jgi:hypothetical protein